MSPTEERHRQGRRGGGQGKRVCCKGTGAETRVHDKPAKKPTVYAAGGAGVCGVERRARRAEGLGRALRVLGLPRKWLDASRDGASAVLKEAARASPKVH